METRIRVEKLSKRYGEKQVFCDLDLEVRAGETLAVAGESGCGKTTLLRILVGLEQDYQGSVYLASSETAQVDGRMQEAAGLEPERDARGLAPHERGMALVPQHPVLWNHMTVEDNIYFPIKWRERKAASERVGYICRRLGIAELLRRYPEEISGGQAKRVSLARALAAGRDMLLLDEPLSNLDSDTKDRILTFLQEEYLGRVTTIYVSHDREEIERLTSKVLRMEQFTGQDGSKRRSE